MNAQTFLDNFGYIANAPEGVWRLRELILQLAVSSDLTTRVEDDVPASILFEENQKTRDQLILEKQIKKQKPLSQIAESESPWELPESWKWCRLGEVTSYGSTDKAEFDDVDVDTWVLELEDIEKGTSFLTKKVRAKERRFRSSKNRFISGEVLYGKLRPYLDKVVLADEDGVCTTEIIPVRAYSGILPKYLRWYLKSPFFKEYANSSTHGMNLPRLGTDSARYAPLALPPWKEQKRIVAKVDELMALCDKLEALQEKCEKIGELARTATLGALSGARPRELQVAWTRVQDNIQLLFGGEKALQDFQDTMVQLAIRGLLSPEYERPVETEKIRNSAAKLRSEYQSKNISRKQKSVPLAQVSEWQYPKHWAVESLDNIAVVIGGVTKGRNLKDRNIESFPYLRVANVQRGFFDLSEMKEISIPIEEFEKYKILEEDLLITEGGDWDKVGRTAIWKSQIPNCIHQNHVFKVRIPSDQLLNEWVALVLNSEVGKQYFASASKQTTNLASINMTQLRSFLLPIPHIIEQKAILQKVNSLVMLYQKATAQSIQEANLASDLAAAIVGRVTGTQFKEQEKMKAPKMELVSKLKVGSSPKPKDQAPLTSLLTKNQGELSAKTLWTHSDLKIDEFYLQLKTEMANGWIVEPEKAVMREVTAD